MKKIINPWKKLEGYNCFGCSPDNEYGVKMDFYEDADQVVSVWKPDGHYQGFLHTLHGGIQSVLLDEICGWVVFRKLQTAGMTTRMETRYRKAVSTDFVRRPFVPISRSRRRRPRRKCTSAVVRWGPKTWLWSRCCRPNDCRTFGL